MPFLINPIFEEVVKKHLHMPYNLIVFLLLSFSLSVDAASIKGKIDIDDSWEATIYLSMINSFDDMHAASYDFLIREAPIDSIGNFEMLDLTLPDGNRVYRLHICKKGDPVSTIIIGGKDENFIHFIMDYQSEIHVSPDKSNNGIQHSKITGYTANYSMEYLIVLQKQFHTPPALPSTINRELVKEQLLNKYRAVADTSTFAIIKLFAAYLILESNTDQDFDFLDNTMSELKLSDSSSPYYLAFVDRLDYLKFQSEKSEFKNPAWIKWAGLLLLILFLGLAFWWRVRRELKDNSKPKTELISSLSIQEKRVFDLLKTGASNKEISAELNIEVSTVKSHVNKIYSRLGVKSRKEIVNKNWG